MPAPEKNALRGLLNCGFDNWVVSDSVIAIIEYACTTGRKLIKSALAERPRSVIDVTQGRKTATIIVVSGDRYILSCLPRSVIASRLAAVDLDKPIADPPKKRGRPVGWRKSKPIDVTPDGISTRPAEGS